jgi:hypothetical protein
MGQERSCTGEVREGCVEARLLLLLLLAEG